MKIRKTLMYLPMMIISSYLTDIMMVTILLTFKWTVLHPPKLQR